MIKRKQLFRHKPEEGIYGDCHRTAIACLMDLEPDEVPHFGEDFMDAEKFKISDVMCEDCMDTGWLENAVEGKYACTCVAETEPYKVLQEENAKLRKSSERLQAIRWACGYVENGSCTTLRIYQDDATKDWFSDSGSDSKYQYGESFEQLLDVLVTQMKEEKLAEQGGSQ